MRNWYGCYKPNGKMCVQSLPPRGMTSEGKKITMKNADEVYAEMWEGYKSYDDIKENLEGDSTIYFCELCNHKNDLERCKGFRERAKRKVFY